MIEFIEKGLSKDCSLFIKRLSKDTFIKRELKIKLTRIIVDAFLKRNRGYFTKD